MTRRNFFRSALACFGAMVLAPVRAVCPPPRRLAFTDQPKVLFRGNRIVWVRTLPVIQERYYFSSVCDPTDFDYSPPV